jgi:hypothetical protein
LKRSGFILWISEKYEKGIIEDCRGNEFYFSFDAVKCLTRNLRDDVKVFFTATRLGKYPVAFDVEQFFPSEET